LVAGVSRKTNKLRARNARCRHHQLDHQQTHCKSLQCDSKKGAPMTAEPEPTPSWPVLGLHERRVLGVLVEKAKTTADIYPLSLKALVTGCNQKSNRDPTLELTDLDVEEGLASAQQKALVSRIRSGRVERWRH